MGEDMAEDEMLQADHDERQELRRKLAEALEDLAVARDEREQARLLLEGLKTGKWEGRPTPDLAGKLREVAMWLKTQGSEPYSMIVLEAADGIEAKAAECERLRRAIEADLADRGYEPDCYPAEFKAALATPAADAGESRDG